MRGVVDAATKIDPKLGPVLKWRSPDDAAAWLRKNILTGDAFKLSQLEAAREWIRGISMAGCGLTKADAEIIVDYVRYGRSEEGREKLAAHVAYLTATLDGPATSARALCNRVVRVSKTATIRRRLSAEMMQVATRYAHLARRWPR